MNRITAPQSEASIVPGSLDGAPMAAPSSPPQPSGLLFLCVANSARSQLAEGLARAMAPAGVHIASAGSAPKSVHPLAIQVLQEVGIDISLHRSKALGEVDVSLVGTVITLCAEESCSIPQAQTKLHWPIADPAVASGTEAERLVAFRLARDQIRDKLQSYFAR